MGKFLTALFATILTLILLMVAFIGIYASVPEFKEIVDYGVSLLPTEEETTPDTTTESTTVVDAPVDERVDESVDEPVDESPAAVPSGIDDQEYAIPTGVENPVGQVIQRPVTNTVHVENDVPENVQGKADLEIIEETAEIISDEEADEIEATLSTGPTGEDLTFDPLYYPYYHMLDDMGKELYRQMYANVKAVNPSYRSVNKNAKMADVQKTFAAVFYDHPELYWMGNRFRTLYRPSGDFVEIDMEYNGTQNDQASFEYVTKAMLADISSQPTDFDKEKMAHDILAGHASYSFASKYNQVAYSTFVEKITVCAGYSRALSYLMIESGIPCYTCGGYAGEPHAWNIICLDGDFYNVDLTWDDTDDQRVHTYEWLNGTDADFNPSHTRQDLSVYLPPCNGTKYRVMEKAEQQVITQQPIENPVNETPAADQHTLADYGLSENDVFYDADTYFNAVYNDTLSYGIGTRQYYIAIETSLARALYETADGQTANRNRVLQPFLDNTDAVNVHSTYDPIENIGNATIVLVTITSR